MTALQVRVDVFSRTATRLSDGRELIYYDEEPGRDRRGADVRGLEPVLAASEVRRDVLVGEDVVVAGHRQGRTHLPPADACPLCPSTPTRATEIPAREYDVVVFENRFPSLSPAASDAAAAAALAGGDAAADLFSARPGAGRCEVVCFTSQHTGSFAGLSPRRVEVVLAAWADRTAALARMPGVEHVFVFENRGAEIGVTLAHPHGQIYAYPFVPPRTARMLTAGAEHARVTGACLSCAVHEAELAARVRVVAQTPRWTAYVPYAARWPFEVHIRPHRHLPDLVSLDDEERRELAGLYLDVLRRLDAVFGVEMPYIAAWHQAPVRGPRELSHLFLQVFSIRRAPEKLKYLAGSESALGVFINDIAPEHAAQLLRDAGEGAHAR